VSPRSPGRAAAGAPAGAPLPARIVITEDCEPDVRRALEERPLVALLGRASGDSGDQAADQAVQSIYTAVTALARREGIAVRHLLPKPAALKAHHKTTAVVERRKDIEGGSLEHRWSVFGGPDLGVIVLVTTGSGTKISEDDFAQPAVQLAAQLVHRHRPSVVFARALDRIGRGDPGPLIAVLQHIGKNRPHGGPFIGDDETPLGPVDLRMIRHLYDQAATAQDDARKLMRRNLAGMRERVGIPHDDLPGAWWFGTGRPAPPGMTKLKLKGSDNAAPHTALVLDCPAARPPEELIAGGPPPARTPSGELADQVSLVRWIGEHLYTDGWGKRACAAYLAEHGWAPPAIRARRRVEIVDGDAKQEPALPLRDGQAGRNDGRRALNAFLANLDFYETGELIVHLPDGGAPVCIHGVLPLDGRPWITTTQAARIRTAGARRHSGPRRKHLFAGQPLTLNGHPAVLYPRIRRSDGELLYYFRCASDPRRPVHSPRASAVPPVPATVVAQWYAEALAGLAGPVSLRLVEQPTAADRSQTRVAVLEREIDRLQADQDKREKGLDPARRLSHPHAWKVVWDLVERGAAELSAKRDDLEAARHQERLHRGARTLTGGPLSKLVALAAALSRPYDEGHRLLLRSLTENLAVTITRRPSTGKRPAYELTAELTLRVRDDTDTWRAVSPHRWTGGAVRRTPGRLAAAIDGLYAGRTLPMSLGADWRDWLPSIRTALGCPGSSQFQFAWAQDPRLLRLGMAVVYPRRRVVAVPDDPEQIPRYADPPVDRADLPALARKLHEKVALLRAIHDIYTVPDRQARWIRNPSPAVTAAYAAAATTGGRLPRRDLPDVLRVRPRDRPGEHRLAREWIDDGDGLAELQPCRGRTCGSIRRAVLLVREVTGSLCLDCRTDRAGVTWDPTYDRFTDRPPVA
jgi:hypothetical protein